MAEYVPTIQLKISSGRVDDVFSAGDDAAADKELMFDQIATMLSSEERYKSCDYLLYYANESSDGARTSSRSIDKGCRTSISAWMYRVADHFQINREVVSIALSYIDRVLSANYCADRRTFKLISATSLHLAIKVHYPHQFHEVGSLLPSLSRGDFDVSDVVQMEKEITHSLAWMLNPATPQTITRYILALLPKIEAPRHTMDELAKMALYFAELAACDYYFICTRSSVVAIAGVLNASDAVDIGSYDSSLDPLPYRNEWQTHNVERLLFGLGYAVDWREVANARDRLWRLHKLSSESSSSEVPVISPIPSPKSTREASATDISQHDFHGFPSPACCIDDQFFNFTSDCS